MSYRVKIFITVLVVLSAAILFLYVALDFSNSTLSFYIQELKDVKEKGFYKQEGYYLELESQKAYYGDCLSHFGEISIYDRIIKLDIDSVKLSGSYKSDKSKLELPDLVCMSLFDIPERTGIVTTKVYLGDLGGMYHLIISSGPFGLFIDDYELNVSDGNVRISKKSNFLNFSKCKDQDSTECL